MSVLIPGHWQHAIHLFANLMSLIHGYFTYMSVFNDLAVHVDRYNRAIVLHAVLCICLKNLVSIQILS